MIVMLSAAASFAQATSTTSTQTKKFEVIAVEDGNKLIVKLPEGTKELTVADDFRFNIDGKQMAVRELKPGMKGTATIATTTTVTPVTVTEVKNGTVMQASGSSLLVRTDTGFKMFSQGEIDKRGVKIMRHGEPAELSDFHSGDKLTATIVTSLPPKVMTEQQVNASLAKTGGAAAAPSSTAASKSSSGKSGGNVGSSQSASASQTPAGGGGKKLPKTASNGPSLWLASILSLGAGLFLTLRRRALQ